MSLRPLKFALVAATALTALTACAADSDNQPPLVAGLPVEATVVVGETVRYQLSATDPEGAGVSFQYDWRPKEGPSTLPQATFFSSGSEASFEWAPLASDVTDEGQPLRLIFIVEDDAGARTEKTVALTIVPGNGQPRFTSNASELFDPRAGGELRFEVKVRDDDSGEVELTMDPASAPAGASFEQSGEMTGVFTWKPEAAQLSRRVHTVTFKANDRQNPIVDHRVTIIVRQSGVIDIDTDQTEQACLGEAIITHTPLGAQRTLQPYVVEATIADAARFEEVFVYWTGADALNGDFDPNDESKSLLAVPMEGSGGSFRAEIPNQFDNIERLGPQTLYYQICAIDQDDTSRPVVCAPGTGDLELFWSFTGYQPSTESCIDDNADIQFGNDDFDSPSNLSPSWSSYRVCEGNPDYHRIQVRPGESYLLTTIFPMGQPLTVKAFDDARTPIPLQQSSCTGLVSAEVSVPEGGQTQNFYIQATGNDVTYQLRAIALQGGGEGGCVDASIEPNGDAASATAVVSGDSIDAEICAHGDLDVYRIELSAGDVLTATTTTANGSGTLDMDLFAPSEADKVPQKNQASVFTFSLNNPETLEHQATQTGTYYLMVFNNDAAALAYELSVAVGARPSCPDNDTYSAGGGNHTQAAAAIVPQPEADGVTAMTGLTLCPGQPDWYQRHEFAGVQVLGSLSLTGGEGALSDVTLEVYDAQGTLMDTATPAGGDLEFLYNPVSTAQLFFKISTTRKIDYAFNLARY